MEPLNAKIGHLASKVESGEPIRIGIFGLGSVGHYLLEYLLARCDRQLKLFVVGRNREKLVRDVNILYIAALLRAETVARPEIVEVDFNSIESIEAALRHIEPDVLVNTSRAYSGLKYGSISWSAIRAYGIWAPLSVKYVKNIMRACASTEAATIVINTSYPDATNAWLKSAGMAYPEFGSGNLNHLVPRIKLAAAASLGISDPGEIGGIEVTLATGHFHDVAISKEGTTEGVEPLLEVRYRGKALELDPATIFRSCSIEMPVDQKRNMMNASSNFRIICAILEAARTRSRRTLHVPGLDGMIGGYPFFVEPDAEAPGGFRAGVDESAFALPDMLEHNRRSMYLDGIADVRDGTLFYTPELAAKVKAAFAFDLPESVPLTASDAVAADLIEQVISKRT